jgi:flagellar FliL protein
MAEKKAAANPTEEIEGEELAPPKKKGKLPMIILLVVVLAGGGGAAWWFLKGKKPTDPKALAAQRAEEQSKPPLYTQLDKELTTGLTRSDAEDHYLQVEIKIKIANEHVGEKITQRSPEVRNALLLLMTSKSSEDLKTVEDKQRLATEMAAQINKVIQSTNPQTDGVLGVYFTSFVLQ